MNSGNAVAGFVIDQLAQHGYRIIERSQLKAIMDELDMQSAGLIDPATAARIGKLAGVDAVVTGSVSQYSFDKSIVNISIIPVIVETHRVGATVRIIDVDGADIIYAHTASGHSPSNYVKAGTKAVEAIFKPLFEQVRPAAGGRSSAPESS